MLNWLLGVSGALLLSLAFNVWQWRADIIEDTEAREAVKLAKAEARGEALAETLGKVTAMADQKVLDDKELARLRLEAATQVPEIRTEYRDRVRTVEVPVCRSNDVQADSVNDMLRGKPPTH